MTDSLKLPSPLPWLSRPLVAAVLKAFADHDAEIRFVGGCVRDALLRQLTKKMDLDMATPLVPEKVMAILQKAGINVKPTGIDHGTVTAFGDDEKVEITTLRSDIDTDGRHATVRFGTRWEEDAARRDFTINAMYCDADGTLYDYFDGISHLKEGIVRFIGDPVARVREDYLRILRFFRFYARFGKGEPDPEALGACAALKGQILNVSRERIWMEFSKLLSLDVPHRGLRAMQLCGVLDTLFSFTPDVDRLEAYAQAEAHHDFHAVPVLRLGALFPNAGDTLADQLRLSNREAEWLELIDATLVALTPPALAQAWYWHQDAIAKGREWLTNLAFLYTTVHDNADADEVITFAAGWEAPIFPLSGADLAAIGVEAGPRMGEILREIEKWWVEQNFVPDRGVCYERAQMLVDQAA